MVSVPVPVPVSDRFNFETGARDCQCRFYFETGAGACDSAGACMILKHV